VSFRKLTTFAAVTCAAALAVLGLAGCDSNVGTAAVVGGRHISDSDVSQYLTPQAKPFSIQSGSGGSSTIVPRSYVLGVLIRDEVLTRTLAATKGGMPSQSELTSTEQQLTQGASEQDQQKQYTQYGFTPAFAAIDLRDTTLEAILARRVGATNDAGPLLKAVKKQHVTISVSGRYGTWDPNTLSLSYAPAAGAPSFIQLHSATYGDETAPTTG
jgi:hypothetical protein